MKKRILSMVMAAGMAVSVSGGVLAQMPEPQIVSDWAKEDVREAEFMNIIPEELIRDRNLTEEITRAEFAGVVVKLYEYLVGEMTWHGGYITDIADHEYEMYILGAYNLGITEGTGIDETAGGVIFSPDAKITREQMATMLSRLIKLYNNPEWTLANDDSYHFDISGANTFADDGEMSDYAKEAVYYMSKNGIINGVDGNNFAPKNTATKEQAIVLALRMVNNEKDLYIEEFSENMLNSMSESEITELNKYMSAFSDGGLGSYYEGDFTYSCDKLLTWAYIHQNINEREKILYKESKMGISAADADEIFNRYFGKTIPHETVREWTYEDGVFWHDVADDCSNSVFTIVKKVRDDKDGTFMIYFDSFYLGETYDGGDPDIYSYSLEEASEKYSYDGSGVAEVTEKTENGEKTYELKFYIALD